VQDPSARANSASPSSSVSPIGPGTGTIVTALLLGLAVRYHVLQDGPATVSEGEALVALVAPALQSYLTR
jgi:hypothetical protein